jgi:hypothetical protein
MAAATGVTPRKAWRKARERDDKSIARWLEEDLQSWSLPKLDQGIRAFSEANP